MRGIEGKRDSTRYFLGGLDQGGLGGVKLPSLLLSEKAKLEKGRGIGLGGVFVSKREVGREVGR